MRSCAQTNTRTNAETGTEWCRQTGDRHTLRTHAKHAAQRNHHNNSHAPVVAAYYGTSIVLIYRICRRDKIYTYVTSSCHHTNTQHRPCLQHLNHTTFYYRPHTLIWIYLWKQRELRPVPIRFAIADVSEFPRDIHHMLRRRRRLLLAWHKQELGALMRVSVRLNYTLYTRETRHRRRDIIAQHQPLCVSPSYRVHLGQQHFVHLISIGVLRVTRVRAQVYMLLWDCDQEGGMARTHSIQAYAMRVWCVHSPLGEAIPCNNRCTVWRFGQFFFFFSIFLHSSASNIKHIIIKNFTCK